MALYILNYIVVMFGNYLIWFYERWVKEFFWKMVCKVQMPCNETIK